MFTRHLLYRTGSSFTNIRWQSSMKRIDKVLIANRGEIACRIMKTAKKLGVKTVAVYSDIDKESLHVALADEAYHIGPASVGQSYLRGDKILDVARKSNSQAIHPGYGFLSENVEFAEECQKRNVIFIGPPASAIRDMGIKSTSKAIMSSADVPIIEGYHGEDQSIDTLKKEAARIGYPVMIKAVRGGGGKGMRISNDKSDFEEALESAKTEAQKAFGDSVVLLEKFVGEPRHVEVQVFADMHGNCVHLFERDCSVQRRHQKIIEEAPAPGITDELREKLGMAAVRAAKAVGYVGAGTVEFILDRRTHSFHFMEMNTRLQVEHPITEYITGTDLVEWQLKIASGEKLPLTQEEIKLNGHAFEARIYAEDPRGGFLPGAGPLLYLSTPEAMDDVRIETGVRQGDEVSVHYDPMIAKLVVWGSDRIEALTKLQSKLMDYNIVGLQTNVNFLLDLARHPEFVAGNVHTNFIRDNNETLFRKEVSSNVQLIQGALALIITDDIVEKEKASIANDQFNPFVIETGFRVNYKYEKDVMLMVNDKEVKIKVKFDGGNKYNISLDDGSNWFNVEANIAKDDDKLYLNCNIDGELHKAHVYRNQEIVCLFDESGKIEFQLEKTNFEEDDEEIKTSGNKAVAPMPGILDKILVRAGQSVKFGDPLFVIIAMKMEYIVKASRDAVIDEIFYKVSDNVQKDAVVVKFIEEANV